MVRLLVPEYSPPASGDMVIPTKFKAWCMVRDVGSLFLDPPSDTSLSLSVYD